MDLLVSEQRIEEASVSEYALLQKCRACLMQAWVYQCKLLQIIWFVRQI